MVTNGLMILLRTTTMAAPQQRFSTIISSFTVRLLIAFAISWLIVLIFFASRAISH